MPEIDDAFERLNLILDEFDAGLLTCQTEADTRFRLIDRILTEVLGWKHNNIQAEASNPSGFVDYLLTNDGSLKVVLEAKKKQPTTR